MAKHVLDFDGEPRKLVEDAVQMSRDLYQRLAEQYQRDYLLYRGYVDLATHDVTMPQVAVPKIFSLVEVMAGQQTKAAFGRRPYLPLGTRRPEYQDIVDLQAKFADQLLDQADFESKAAMACKLKILFGTSFVSVTPYYEWVEQRRLVQSTFGQTVETEKVPLLRLRLEVFAPWDVLVDPFATTLESPEGCRYLVKIRLVSKRAIRHMYQQGAFPNFDLSQLDEYAPGRILYEQDHFGIEMLRQYGLTRPEHDDDVGILLSYESPERYIDMWQTLVLQDIENPFKHGLINTSRMVHALEPHTQNQFWGIGESKINEVLANLLNDLWTMAVAAHGMLNQPTVFYRANAFEPEDIVLGFGARIPVNNPDPTARVSDDLFIHAGSGIPRDHYTLAAQVERMMDLGSQSFPPSRGEATRGDTGTATEIAILKQTGDIRQEDLVRNIERIFLRDFARKCYSIIDQFANLDDMVEILGEQSASKLYTANPMDLPVPVNFEFTGSAWLSNMLVKQQNMMQLVPLLVGNPLALQFINPYGVYRRLLEVFDFDESEIDRMLLPEPVAQAQRMLLAQQVFASQAAGTLQPGGNGARPQPTAAATGAPMPGVSPEPDTAALQTIFRRMGLTGGANA